MASGYKINLTLFLVFMAGLALVLATGINKVFFITINSLATHTYPFIWTNLTFLGDTMAACSIMILFIRKRPGFVWSGIIAAIIGTLIANILKTYLNIPRPPAIIDKNVINIIGPIFFSHSFPSGHTVTIFTFAGILIFFFRSLFVRLGLILFALLIGISRIAVGVHWPADVLAGAAIGCLCAMIGVYSVTKLGWGKMKSVQVVLGFVLISSNFYLLFFYNCKYEQAIYLQYFLASATLIAGIREYYFLLTKNGD
jgi:membrane-associated phospholipid phosphatase